MVGIAKDGCGNFAHELVHLAIKNNFGDSPAWLEEGLASEIAVAGINNKQFTFGWRWRDEKLRARWQLRPTMGELLKMNWSDFTANNAGQLKRVAAIHAMDAVFVRYLASQTKLAPIYFAIRDRQLSDEAAGTRSDRDIVESILGKDVVQIDSDFVNWFNSERARPRSQSR